MQELTEELRQAQQAASQNSERLNENKQALDQAEKANEALKAEVSQLTTSRQLGEQQLGQALQQVAKLEVCLSLSLYLSILSLLVDNS